MAIEIVLIYSWNTAVFRKLWPFPRGSPPVLKGAHSTEAGHQIQAAERKIGIASAGDTRSIQGKLLLQLLLLDTSGETEVSIDRFYFYYFDVSNKKSHRQTTQDVSQYLEILDFDVWCTIVGTRYMNMAQFRMFKSIVEVNKNIQTEYGFSCFWCFWQFELERISVTALSLSLSLSCSFRLGWTAALRELPIR